MNMFILLNEHHKTPDLTTAAALDIYLNQARANAGPVKIQYGEIILTSVQAALILSYAGNINRCLPDREYNQFHDILRMAIVGMRTNTKTSPMTSTITSYVRKAAGY